VILIYFCHYIVLVMIGGCFGIVLAMCVREQTRNPTSLAQAGPSRLSEVARRTWEFERDISPRREVL